MALVSLLFAIALQAQDHTVIFNTTDPGVTKSISTWGMDTTWASYDNIRGGIIYMGTNQIDVIRVGFMVNDALDASGQLSAAAKTTLDTMKNVANSAGDKPWMFSPVTAAGVNAWFKTSSTDVNTTRWVQAMDAAKQYLNKSILWAEPFNEPDYSPWNEGTTANLYDIMGLLQADTNFSSTLLAGGSTLSCGNANYWYDAVKSRAAIGTTHCLAGTFANYTNWLQDVKSSGDFVLNPEVHNTVEVIAGAEYGLQGGIWWGTSDLGRGQFVKSCQGKRLAYAEDQARFSAAAVYRAPDGVIRCFAGSSERQGLTTSYKFICADRDVWFNGQGPMREYTMTVGPNGEDFVEVRWGADVQPAINGKHVVVARHSGKVMDVSGASTNNGANIWQYSYNGGNQQKWDIATVGDGYYTMKAAHSGRLAEVAGGAIVASGNVQQWDNTGGANQQWFFEYLGNGYFNIRNRFSGLYLDVAGVSTNDTANIWQWDGTGGANQQWRLVPAGCWTKVDDVNSNASYTANWGTYIGNPGYQMTEHYSGTTGATVTFSFTGSQVRYYGFNRSDLGIAAILVDGVMVTNIDCYSATGLYNQLLFQSAMLTAGPHTLKVQVTGNKNAASSGVSVIADAFEYFTDTPVDFIPPAAPTGLSAIARQVSVSLSWSANVESDLGSYTVYRSMTSGGPYDTIVTGVKTNTYTDKSANSATNYYYVLRALDYSANQSGYSAQVSAMPGGGPALVAEYLMEGNVNDSSGNANHGVVTGAPTYVSGKFGQAISLEGVASYVALPAGSANCTDITIAAWVNWVGGAAWQRIFDFGSDTAHNLFLTPKSASNTLRFGINNGGVEQDLNTTVLPTNQWVHVAVVLQGNTGRLYVNGVLKDTQTITYNPSDFNPVSNWIGKSEYADPLLIGRVDDFCIYNYALSGSEIGILANPNIFPQTIVSSSPFSVRVSGVAGHTYVFQRAASLVNPIWFNVATNGSLAFNQPVVFTDPATPAGGVFYRTLITTP